MRLYALYGRNRKILAFLCVFYVGVLTSETIIIGVAVHYISCTSSFSLSLFRYVECIGSCTSPWTARRRYWLHTFRGSALDVDVLASHADVRNTTAGNVPLEVGMAHIRGQKAPDHLRLAAGLHDLLWRRCVGHHYEFGWLENRRGA